MPELKALPTQILLHIAKLLNVPMKGLVAVIELLDEGATVPFIARYRKEVTGNLDEVQIRDIQEKLEYFRELEERRETVLASIAEQGKLTAELKARDRSDAREDRAGGPVPALQAQAAHQGDDRAREGTGAAGAVSCGSRSAGAPLGEFSASFVNENLGVATAEEALEGARHIVAEWISEKADFRKAVREHDGGRGPSGLRTPSKAWPTPKASSRCTRTTASRWRRFRRTACWPFAAARRKASSRSRSSWSARSRSTGCGPR